MIIDPYCERPPVHYLVLGGFDELVLLMFTRDCIVCVRPVAANTIDHVCLLQHLVVNQVVHAVNCLKRWLQVDIHFARTCRTNFARTLHENPTFC